MTKDTKFNNAYHRSLNKTVNGQPVSTIISDFLTSPNNSNTADITKLRHFFNYISKSFGDTLSNFINKEIIAETGDLTNIDNSTTKDDLADNDYLCLFTSEGWGGKVFFVFKESFIGFMVDAFYGAPAPKLTSRKTQKLSIGEKMTITEASKSLASLFNKRLNVVDNSHLIYKMGVSANKLFEETSLPTSMYKIEFKVTIGDCTASMYILAPHKCYEMLEEVADNYLNSDLTQIDPIWRNSLQKEIKSTDMRIQAYISLGEVSLNSLADLKIGQNLALPFNAFSRVNVATPDKLLYTGSLGRIGKNYSVKIDQLVGREN